MVSPHWDDAVSGFVDVHQPGAQISRVFHGTQRHAFHTVETHTHIKISLHCWFTKSEKNVQKNSLWLKGQTKPHGVFLEGLLDSDEVGKYFVLHQVSYRGHWLVMLTTKAKASHHTNHTSETYPQARPRLMVLLLMAPGQRQRNRQRKVGHEFHPAAAVDFLPAMLSNACSPEEHCLLTV